MTRSALLSLAIALSSILIAAPPTPAAADATFIPIVQRGNAYYRFNQATRRHDILVPNYMPATMRERAMIAHERDESGNQAPDVTYAEPTPSTATTPAVPAGEQAVAEPPPAAPARGRTPRRTSGRRMTNAEMTDVAGGVARSISAVRLSAEEKVAAVRRGRGSVRPLENDVAEAKVRGSRRPSASPAPPSGEALSAERKAWAASAAARGVSDATLTREIASSNPPSPRRETAAARRAREAAIRSDVGTPAPGTRATRTATQRPRTRR